jgi:glycosyltransferase involved in cell wall biosynthesis
MNQPESLPSISVVIPCYNAVTTLGQTLSRVYAQTIPVKEVIVVDDGSSDETPCLIAEKFPQAKYVRQRNQGVSAARNNGIELAQSEWVALLDADDLWLPHKLERQLHILSRDPKARFITTGRYYEREGEANVVNWTFRWRFAKLLSHNRVHTSSALIKREVFEQIGGFDPRLKTGEDWDLWLRIVNKFPSYGTTEKLVQRERVTGSLSEDRLRIYLNNITVLGRWNPKHRDSTINYGKYRRIVWRHAFEGIKRLKRIDPSFACTYWEVAKRRLPFSVTGEWVLNQLLQHTVTINERRKLR